MLPKSSEKSWVLCAQLAIRVSTQAMLHNDGMRVERCSETSRAPAQLLRSTELDARSEGIDYHKPQREREWVN